MRICCALPPILAQQLYSGTLQFLPFITPQQPCSNLALTSRPPCPCLALSPPVIAFRCYQVSAKTEEADIVQGLRCGADDYITKPFKRAELAARIRAHIRARDAFAQQQAAEQAWLMQHNLLPPNVQRKLRAGETVIAESHPAATVLWAEVVGGLAGNASPGSVAAAAAQTEQQEQKHDQVVGTGANSQLQHVGTGSGGAAGSRVSCERVLSPAEAVVTLNSLYTTWEELCGQRVRRINALAMYFLCKSPVAVCSGCY
jgi:hypothetical protein